MLQWDENLDTGIRWIDEQHRIFLMKMGDFLDASITGRGEAEAITALKNVEDYINSHFNLEEKYMLQFDYSEQKNHKSEHKKYKLKLKELKGKYNIEGASNDFIREFQLGIIDWYKNHIRVCDKKFAQFLKTKG